MKQPIPNNRFGQTHVSMNHNLCKICGTLLLREINGDTMTFVCKKCSNEKAPKVYAATAEDSLIFSGKMGTTVGFDPVIAIAGRDPTAAVCKVPCKKCGRPVQIMTRVGPDEVVQFICEICDIGPDGLLKRNTDGTTRKVSETPAKE